MVFLVNAFTAQNFSKVLPAVLTNHTVFPLSEHIPHATLLCIDCSLVVLLYGCNCLFLQPKAKAYGLPISLQMDPNIIH